MDAEEKWGVRGIVSFGHPQCNIGKPGVYTNVQQHIEWIKDTMNEAIAKHAKEQLTSGISGLVIDSDMDKTKE